MRWARVARPLASVAVRTLLGPRRKVMVPVGVPKPVTVAVRVTGWPGPAGLALLVSVVVLAARLTARPGSSAYVLGGITAYANSAKEQLVGVPAELLAEHGAVSPEVAVALAEGARARFGADLGVGLRDRHVDNRVRFDAIQQLLQRGGHRDGCEAGVRCGAPGGIEVEVCQADEPDVPREADHAKPGAAHQAGAHLDQPDRLSW